MIIEEIKGDLWAQLDADRPAGGDQWRLVAHGCNMEGVMGAGFAKTVKDRYPETYEAYKRDIRKEGVLPETLGLVFHHRPSKDLNTIIFNCYTQILRGPNANKLAVACALARVWRVLVSLDIADQPVYIPRIGAGIGGLDYEKDVKPLFEESNLWLKVFYL